MSEHASILDKAGEFEAPLMCLVSEVNGIMKSRCLACRGEYFPERERRANINGLWSVRM